MNAKPLRLWLASIAFFILLIFGLCYWALPKFNLPIRHVTVNGSYQYITTQEIQKKLLPLLKGGFFNIDFNRAQAELTAIPGIKQASVRRVWPDTIEVSLIENKALAHWNHDGQLFAHNGTLFHPLRQALQQNLPILSGQAQDGSLVFKTFRQLQQLSPANLKITGLKLLDTDQWQVSFKNFYVSLGATDPVDKYRLFVKIYPKFQLDNNAGTPLYFNMNYPNGIAVKWRNKT